MLLHLTSHFVSAYISEDTKLDNLDMHFFQVAPLLGKEVEVFLTGYIISIPVT